jgi:hypothetical protein
VDIGVNKTWFIDAIPALLISASRRPLAPDDRGEHRVHLLSSATSRQKWV